MVILYASALAQENNEKWCVKEHSFTGKCETDPPEACAKDFIKEYGAKSNPRNCNCKTISKNQNKRYDLYSRFCTCQIICNQL
ncbi:hypothetical protein M5689_023784 [Euphorbia peplus]|nr:hypothetical protein M5689_023784 [Euphorbia peplus]